MIYARYLTMCFEKIVFVEDSMVIICTNQHDRGVENVCENSVWAEILRNKLK